MDRIDQDGFLKVLGRRLRDARQARNLNQNQLMAEFHELGVSISRSYVSQIEKGSVNPGVLFVFTWCKVCGVDANHVLGLMDVEQPINRDRFGHNAVKVALMVDDMETTKQRIAVELVKAYWKAQLGLLEPEG